MPEELSNTEPVEEVEVIEEPEEYDPEAEVREQIGVDPTAKHSDGISDLFEVDNDPDTDDVVSVDMEKDILDADEDGGFDDLLTVTEEDVMGDDIGQTPLKRKPRRIVRRVRRTDRPYYPPTTLGGIR